MENTENVVPQKPADRGLSKTIYLHNNSSFSKEGRFTVCGIYSDYVLRIGVAFCSNTDNFNKKIGRELALERAKVAMFRITIETNKLKNKVMYDVVEMISGRPDFYRKVLIPLSLK